MRPRQLAARPRRLLPPSLLAAGAPPDGRWNGCASGLAIDRAPQSGFQPDPTSDGVFRAFGRHRSFPAPEFWSDTSDGLLFLFHLHGFAPLARYAAGHRTSKGDAFWQAVLEDWLRAYGVPKRIAWHPYPTSGRVMAWCAALSAAGWGADLQARLRASLRRQSTMLRRSVEHDVGGNHVLRNGFAMLMAGICLATSA